MVKNVYPLLLISELIDKLAKTKIFIKLDLQNGYNNIHIRKGDQWKAAFTTNKRLFKPNVMFFGMTNAPATFQHMMNNVFSDMIAKGWVIIYMDDILIFSQEPAEHKE